jgi:hypothetical protein
VKRIPLMSRRGVTGYAIVDDEDYDRLVERRWFKSVYGYAAHRERRDGVLTYYWMHREVLGLSRDDPRVTDHINGDKLDNRRANLRPATKSLNVHNSTAGYGTSPIRGVSFDKRRGYWRATFCGRELGCYPTEQEAAVVVASAREAHIEREAEVAASY